jgi:hypothetical protein
LFFVGGSGHVTRTSKVTVTSLLLLLELYLDLLFNKLPF